MLNHAARLDIPAPPRASHRSPRTPSGGHAVGVVRQPFHRIAALTVDDVVVENGGIGIRLGQGVSPVPPPFAAMVHDLLVGRPNLNTATNPTSGWLCWHRAAG